MKNSKPSGRRRLREEIEVSPGGYFPRNLRKLRDARDSCDPQNSPSLRGSRRLRNS